MKKVLATAVLAALIGFGSGCNNDKKKVADVPASPPLDNPPAAVYVPPSPSVMQLPNSAPAGNTSMVAAAPTGTGDATPMKSTGKTTKSHSGTHSTAGTSKITGASYTIKSGDTLQKISQSKYGTTKRWKAILKANPQIKDPNKLTVGQKIKLP